HLALSGQPKASFTHIIAWAIVKALKEYPRMNAAFTVSDSTPTRIDREDVNIGLAIDVEKKDGSRSLLVPNIKRAQTLDFAQFLKGYNDVVRKARNNTLEIADFEGTTISLTNPGTHPRAAAGRRQLLRRRLSRPPHPLRAGPLGEGPQPPQRQRRRARGARSGRAADDQRLPRARPPAGRPRSPRVRGQAPPRAR